VVERVYHIVVAAPAQRNHFLHVAEHWVVEQVWPRHPLLLVEADHPPQDVDQVFAPGRLAEVHRGLLIVLNSLHVFFRWVGRPTIQQLEYDHPQREDICFVGVAVMTELPLHSPAAVQFRRPINGQYVVHPEYRKVHIEDDATKGSAGDLGLALVEHNVLGLEIAVQEFHVIHGSIPFDQLAEYQQLKLNSLAYRFVLAQRVLLMPGVVLQRARLAVVEVQIQVLIGAQVRVHFDDVRRPQRLQHIQISLHFVYALLVCVLHADAFHDEIQPWLLGLLRQKNSPV
jgi:hypothetical protein